MTFGRRSGSTSAPTTTTSPAKGVPVLFFFNGTHEDYHGRDDEVDRIDAEKAVRVSQLIFYLGYELANRPERPRWNPDSRRQDRIEPVAVFLDRVGVGTGLFGGILRHLGPLKRKKMPLALEAGGVKGGNQAFASLAVPQGN